MLSRHPCRASLAQARRARLEFRGPPAAPTPAERESCTARSRRRAVQRIPTSRASCSRRARDRYRRGIPWRPHVQKGRAVSLPIPEAAPVTKVALSASRAAMESLLPVQVPQSLFSHPRSNNGANGHYPRLCKRSAMQRNLSEADGQDRCATDAHPSVSEECGDPGSRSVAPVLRGQIFLPFAIRASTIARR
jgi:hypothetical protein